MEKTQQTEKFLQLAEILGITNSVTPEVKKDLLEELPPIKDNEEVIDELTEIEIALWVSLDQTKKAGREAIGNSEKMIETYHLAAKAEALNKVFWLSIEGRLHKKSKREDFNSLGIRKGGKIVEFKEYRQNHDNLEFTIVVGMHR